MSKILRLYEENPDPALIAEVVGCLRDGGIIIYPTDTLYGIGCAIDKSRMVEKIIQIKELKPKNVQFSFICTSIAQISEFARVNDASFKLLRDNLPGPFTFVLPGLSRVPPYFISKRKTVGVRIPNNEIPCRIVSELGVPILSTSLPQSDDPSYISDPSLMYERWGSVVDMVIDGGIGGTAPSTVVDCTGAEPEILRPGKGELLFS